jgi:tRNA(His) 5'-end guanylyltransferase
VIDRPRSRRVDLAPEYRFDYRKARKNRFAHRMRTDAVVVVLDADVAEVFRDSREVNAVLRAAIAAFRTRRSKRAV